MKNILTLAKIEIKALFAKTTILNKKNSKKTTVGLLAILIPVIAIIYIATVYNLMFASLLNSYNMHLIIVFGSFLTIMMLLILTTFNSSGHLFEFKDYDLLISLPLKNQEILAAKLVSFLAYNYLFAFFLLLPSLGVYAYNVYCQWDFYLYAFFLFVFIPIVPLIVASIISFIIYFISVNTRYKNIFVTLISLVMLLLLMFTSFNIEKYLNEIIINSDQIIKNLRIFYPFGYYGVQALIDQDFMSLLIFIFSNLLLFIIFVYIFQRSFYLINAKGQKKRVNKIKGKISYQPKSTINALFNKELKKYLQSPMYILNTAFGPLLMTVFLISSLVMYKSDVNKIISLFQMNDFNMFFVLAAIVVICVPSITTSVSISLEGKKLWILKSLPIDPLDIYVAKLLLNLVVIVPFLLIDIIIVAILFDLGILNFLIACLTLILVVVCFGTIGLIVNLYFPRFDFTNEVLVIKQSMSMMICLGVNALIAFVLGYSYFKIIKDFNYFLFFALSFLCILDFGMWFFLKTKGTKLFYDLH